MRNSVQIQNKNNNLLKFMRMLLRESTAAVTIKQKPESRMQYEQKISLGTIAPSSIFSIAIVVLLVLNGLLVAGRSQGNPRREWVNPEHPFTAISSESDVHANHNEAFA
jgi:hypothetical protein